MNEQAHRGIWLPPLALRPRRSGNHRSSIMWVINEEKKQNGLSMWPGLPAGLKEKLLNYFKLYFIIRYFDFMAPSEFSIQISITGCQE